LGTPLGQLLGVLLLLPSLRGVDPYDELIQFSPSSCSGVFLVNGVGKMICSMWWRTEEEAANKRTPRAKGAPNWARSGLGRFGPGFLPGCFSHNPLFACTCMWDFDIVSFMVKA
jgi:hypothetical protein